MYHYTECGLPRVWLANGYQFEKTVQGDVVHIENVEGLHKAIGLDIANQKPYLTGREFRFLRVELGLSQAKLATVFGNNVQSVANWEKRGRVPKWAERFLRAIYRETVEGNAHLVRMIEQLDDASATVKEGERDVFEETASGWLPRAA